MSKKSCQLDGNLNEFTSSSIELTLSYLQVIGFSNSNQVGQRGWCLRVCWNECGGQLTVGIILVTFLFFLQIHVSYKRGSCSRLSSASLLIVSATIWTVLTGKKTPRDCIERLFVLPYPSPSLCLSLSLCLPIFVSPNTEAILTNRQYLSPPRVLSSRFPPVSPRLKCWALFSIVDGVCDSACSAGVNMMDKLRQ